ncbi:MAG: hypothetical protein QXJ72_08475 [Thermoproteota archaeon]
MRRISWKKMRRAIILGAIWGFISSCAVFPEQYIFTNLIILLHGHINYLKERCPPTVPLGDYFPPPWATILYLASRVVFLPAVPFQSFELLGIFLSIITGVAIRAIIELFLEIRRSRRGDIAE